MTDRVLVTGATGGVGQLTVAKLLEKSFSVRVLTRSAEKAEKMFDGKVEVAIGDVRDRTTLPPATQDITHIICCTGTTAFPSTRWELEIAPETQGFAQWFAWGKVFLDAEYCRTKARNSPEKVDAEGVNNLVAAASPDLKRFVFVSSCGVERKDQPPYNILNLFGVLDAKQKGEAAIVESGLPYTLIRPGRLIDGPYTSYDLNTLMKASTGGKSGVTIAPGDSLNGQSSRVDVAAACVECLNDPVTAGKAFGLINQGTRPAVMDWATLFAQLNSPDPSA
ncbi:MAG: SDR family oxidoreductase [Kovacikia sp.]